MEIILEVLQHSLMISGFVLSMMILVEYITIQTKGQWAKPFKKHPWLQILLGTVLGITPGCLGGFTIITLYSHKIVSFPALVSAMIATSGDEAFLMFSMMPGKALEIHIYLFLIALISGVALMLFKRKNTLIDNHDQHDHEQYHANEPDCYCFDKTLIIPQLRQITFVRALLLFIGVGFLFLVITGHHHEAQQVQNHAHDHLHDHAGHDHGYQINWQKMLFLSLTIFFLFITTTVPDHFLREHIWEHTIKKHLPKIFLWTFGAFMLIHGLEDYINVKDWIADNLWLVLLIAVLVGMIPESGPHIIFISLFVQGSLPLSILLANSIVQDGHAALPLLAESPRSFILVKVINLLIGFAVGATLLFAGT